MHPHMTLLHKFQATSAFDGTHASKWEEPNGSKGIKDRLRIVPSVASSTKLMETKQHEVARVYVQIFSFSFFSTEQNADGFDLIFP